MNFIWAGAIAASTARQPLGRSPGTSQDHAAFPSKPLARVGMQSAPQAPKEMLTGKPAHPEQMENSIQLFLWLQLSARLDKGKAAMWGLSAGAPPCWKAESHRAGATLGPNGAGSEITRWSFMRWKPLAGIRRARDGKPSPAVCGNSRQADAGTGSLKTKVRRAVGRDILSMGQPFGDFEGLRDH